MDFVTGHAGTEHISSSDMASMLRGLVGSTDCVLPEAGCLSCDLLDANTVEIGTGGCMLQGHYARIDVPEQVTFASGTYGWYRNDLLVARYSLSNSDVQSVTLAVVEGEATTGTPVDPDLETGDIDNGALTVEFALWRIVHEGTSVRTPERVMPIRNPMLDLVYPVGSIYQSVTNVNPSETLGGTWEQIQNRFLLAAGSNYAAGSTGGEAAHTLTTSEMPAHTHTFSGASSTTGGQSASHTHSGTTGGAGGHSHSYNQPIDGYSGSDARYIAGDDYRWPWTHICGGAGPVSTSSSGSHTHGFSTGGASNDHTHTVTPRGSNANTGGGGSHNNMPPYVAVYVWKRTA